MNYNIEKRERLMAARAELCQSAIQIAGMTLTPDESKGYFEFLISQGLQIDAENKLCGVNAYMTSLHPGTVGNSFSSMLHQPLNRGHEMKAYDPEKIARDRMLGMVAAVEYPKAPGGQWTVKPGGNVNPIIRAAASFAKKAEGMDRILGEHQTGKHKWNVSMEVNYNVMESGFVVGNRSQAKKKQEEYLAHLTPDEFSGTDYGYIPVNSEEAQSGELDELLDCYNMDKNRVDKTWDGLPVTLMKGGINGQVHYMGVGMVRYPAEREAEITQLLAADPNALPMLAEDGVVTLIEGIKTILENVKKVVDRR